ncbi:MAG: nuclear transport factor 2 family protein [Thermomicrobiales bacterium]
MTDIVTPGASPELVSLIERYLASWNEPDRDARDALIAATWSADGVYADPLFEASGRLGIGEMIAGFQETYPDHLFTRVGEVEEHHGRLRFRWQLADADGNPQLAGTDFGMLGADGLLVSITGFFDTNPA